MGTRNVSRGAGNEQIESTPEDVARPIKSPHFRMGRISGWTFVVVLMVSGCASSIGGEALPAPVWQGGRIFLLDEVDQLLADVAAQVERVRGRARTRQRAQLDRAFLAVGHLQLGDLTVPQLG